MAVPKKITEPHKELRFTRSAQGQTFIVAAAVSFALTLIFFLTWFLGHPSFPWWLPLIPLILSGLLARLASRCIRHAYLILTPLGIEIFPFFKPEKFLNLISWSEINHAEFNPTLTLLTLHRNPEKSSGVVISLKPILPEKRPLLKTALEGRLNPTP